MVQWLNIRDAKPEDAPFLAKCILSGLHLSDFSEYPSDYISDVLSALTACERREDTLCSYQKTRVAEVKGVLAGALLSYPGELYGELREKTLREYWPDFFKQFSSDDPETDPGEYYLDSLAVIPEYRRLGIGKALLKDGISLGLSKGFSKIALVADSGCPHLMRMYESLGFIPADHRHVFGTDFTRMVYSV